MEKAFPTPGAMNREATPRDFVGDCTISCNRQQSPLWSPVMDSAFQNFIDHYEQIFAFWTSPMEYTFADYPRMSTPMLMMLGDRDDTCRLSEAYELFQQLPRGEFGIIPGTPHQLSRVGCLMALDYLQRHRDDSHD